MLEVAEIVRLHGAAFLTRFRDRLLPAQRRALRDIQECRTSCLGGHVKQCNDCGEKVYAYHSCRNRHCPKCQGDRAQRWLDQQGSALLPCSYYLITFTLPSSLRAPGFCSPERDLWNTA